MIAIPVFNGAASDEDRFAGVPDQAAQKPKLVAAAMTSIFGPYIRFRATPMLAEYKMQWRSKPANRAVRALLSELLSGFLFITTPLQFWSLVIKKGYTPT